ncbi:D-2-hydroxyacid dehydrogenase [Hydrogenoanaerobacterium sp.]|uniref:D-2-hydroxyacid dehydrogenase n=1 Tax=Hydrogenoanaerobacterium sp. TaxID=2953763 RepID=UPI0028A03CC5|nr:D-2-hydroxyacid dehydrogenase [Hydrogenoanaerobacterium sp.]
MSKQVLVLIPMDDAHKKHLEQIAPDAEFTYAKERTVTKEQVQAANIILGSPPAFMLKDSPNLELLQLNSAGANRYIPEGVLPAGVKLCNATGAYGLAISEYMVGVLLTLYKDLHRYRDHQHKGLWKDLGSTKSIYGSTVLIVGLGDIGSEFARRIKAFGGYTIGLRRSGTAKPEFIDELYLTEQLDALLPRADVVALCLPETPATKGLMNQERLSLCKQGAVLINVGRGSAVDTEALCNALESGHLKGAAVDVTDPEPLPADHRMWGLENVIITPHVSGGYHDGETHQRILRIAEQNLSAYLAGEKLMNPVDFTTGYKVSNK